MKILILNGNPNNTSFCNEIAKQYYKGAKSSTHEVELVNLYDLNFDPILHKGYSETQELEPDIKRQQELIKWCDHLVIVTAVWWLSTPALLKGYFDRVLLPGYAFKFTGPGQWQKLLKGRSAHVIYTQGAPCWFTSLIYGDPFWKTINAGTLGFCGFDPVRRTCFGQISDVKQEKRQQWLKQVYDLGKKAS